MRIAITGSSCTGKTTLIRALLARGLCAPHVVCRANADARVVMMQMGYTAMDAMDGSALRKFQLFYLKQKLRLETNRCNYVADRSFIDLAAYWSERFLNRCRSPYVDMCRKRAREYDLHFFLRFGDLPFVSDGFRPTDLDFHRRIDDRIANLLASWEIRYHEVVADSVEGRCEELEYVIGRYIASNGQHST